MQLPFTIIFLASALPAVLAEPSSTQITQDSGIKLKLTEIGTIQRVAADGTLLGEVTPAPESLETFAALASRQSQFRREETHVLTPRSCRYGIPCSNAETCWFNGCDYCASPGPGGYCVGQIS